MSSGYDRPLYLLPFEERATREEAVSRIAQRYQEWAAIFERQRP